MNPQPTAFGTIRESAAGDLPNTDVDRGLIRSAPRLSPHARASGYGRQSVIHRSAWKGKLCIVRYPQATAKIPHLGDAPWRHRRLDYGMNRSEGRPLLGNGYYLDLVNRFGLIVLRRDDGTEVANFSVWEATGDAIEQAAREDQRTNQKAEGAGRVR